jgi:hypothetical protein
MVSIIIQSVDLVVWANITYIGDFFTPLLETTKHFQIRLQKIDFTFYTFIKFNKLALGPFHKGVV